MADTRLCDLIRDDLAALYDGDLDPTLAEHLSECDACRDLRHDIRRAVEEVAASGDDYVHPAGLDQRLLAAIDAHAATRNEDHARPIPALAPVQPVQPAAEIHAAPGPVQPQSLDAAAIAPTLAMPAMTTPAVQAPAPTGYAPAPVLAPAPSPAAARSARSSRAGRRAAWVAGGLLLASAAAAPFVLRHASPERGADNVAREASNPWRGRLVEVVRAATDRAGSGVEVLLPGASAFVALAEGAEVPPGAEVRTDARTRARVDLGDGSHLVLDRATILALDRGLPRAARLSSGNVVADVAHVEGAPPARIALSEGGVTVMGTKFALTSFEGRSSVRVTRGRVQLTDGRGHVVDVKTGEEGVLARGGLPEVMPAVDLANAVAWSELMGEVRTEREAPVVGLGELRARRPGQTNERDHAVAMTSHQVRVRIVGNIARTEIEETFRNDTPHELEGIYRFPLPPEAQIERLALDVEGRMEEGDFVDRRRAAAIWRGVIRNAVHPMQRAQETQELVWVPGPWQDPALLEWQRGGRYELRIFPIPARGSRRVALSYTQTIAPSGGVRRYIYPLAHDTNGSTRVEQFDVDVQVMGHDPAWGVRVRGYPLADNGAGAPAGVSRMSFSQAGFVPAGDLVIEYALPDRNEPLTAWAYQPSIVTTATPDTRASSSVQGRGSSFAASGAAAPVAPEEAYVALALRPALPRWTDMRPRDYAIVVDTSRSMVGERFARATRLARAVINEMDPRDRVVVLACDTTCRAMPGGLQPGGVQAARSAEAFLAGQEPAGASDLGAQVREAAALLRASAPERDARIVYMGDGAATVGYRRPELLGAEVAEAMPAGRATLTAVALGVDADTTLLGAMARAGGGVVVPYVPGESVAAASLSVLEATYGVTLRDPTLELPAGLRAISPSSLPTVRAGGELIVVARMSGPEVRGEAVLRGTVGGERFEARYPLLVRASSSEGNAFVPRLYAATRIAELEARGGEGSREEIVSLSQRFHVASRYTSLLVLESEAMRRAFHVQRQTGSDVVVWTGNTNSEATTATAASESERAQMARVSGQIVPADESERADNGNISTDGSSGNAQGYGAGRGPRARDGVDAVVADRESGGEEDDRGVDLAQAPTGAPSASRAAPAPMMEAQPVAPPAPSMMRRMSAPAVVANPQHPRPRPRPNWGTWMRRIWVRRGSVVPGVGSVDRRRIEEARLALEAMPDSRDRHRELYRRLSVAGEIDAAAEIANRWSSRDALDPEAIARMADVAARRGERERALRILAGIVDVRPEDVSGIERMAALHERAGEGERACAYRVSIAEVRSSDADALANALRCERAQGRAAAAMRLLEAITDPALRRRVEAAAVLPVPVPSSVRGEVTLSASWDVPADLDLALIDPRGNRISWMGGRSGITARSVRDTHAEALGVARPSLGEYVVEVSRTSVDGRMIRGHVEVNALGDRRTVSFTLMPGTDTQRVARVNITREAQLVPLR